MKKSTKYMMVTAAASVMMLGSFSVSYAATGWASETVDKATIWRWYDANGNMVKSDWVQSPTSGLWYYFDRDGVMLHDCWGVDTKSEGYYFGTNGEMATGWRWLKLDQEEESYGPGSDKSEEGYFYFGSGKVQEGWLNLNGTYYYLNDGYVDGFADYQMVYGEVEIDGEEYYFGDAKDGSMKKGKVKVVTESNANTPSSTTRESYYLYRENGTRAVGDWCKYDGQWYYVNEDGEMVAEDFIGFDNKGNETDIDDATDIYYMDKEGIMVKGWKEFGTEQEVRPGVVKGKTFYHFGNGGVMSLGWVKDGGKWYYMSPEEKDDWKKGQMVTGLYEISGKTYYFAKNGTMTTSDLIKIEDQNGNDHQVYFDNDGIMVKGTDNNHLAWKKIGTKNYFFDADGYCLEKGSIVREANGSYVLQPGTDNLKAGDKYWEIQSNGSAKQYTKK